MDSGTQKILVVTFYKFVQITGLETLQVSIRDCMTENGLKGTVLLASEGINATVSGLPIGLEKLLTFLKSFPCFHDLTWKESYAESAPFKRIKVKIKPEIISLGVPANPTKKVGKYISPKAWNELISDPEVLLIDTRNSYEVEMGTFKGALNPRTDTFKDIPKFTSELVRERKPKKVAMFCTGGIRCEKYSAYMLEQGLDEVYHLQGGILKYLEEIPEDQSLWEGDCFVFDERHKLNHNSFISKNKLDIQPESGVIIKSNE